ncbi:hypothetical protein ACP3WI_25095, partial [Salmonella enterica]
AGGIALLGSAFALVSGAAVGWLPAGWGGILGLAVSDLLRAAIALIGNSEAVLWTTRGAAAIVGLCGLALWAYSFTI